MYNQEIKERFLHEFTSGGRNENGVLIKLDAISIYEEQINTDLAEMTIEDAIEAIRNIKIGTYYSASSAQNLVRGYVKWCFDNRVFSGVNPSLLTISIDDIDPTRYMKSIWFKDEEDFIYKMKTVRSFDDGHYEIIVAIFAWLGVDQKDILKICSDDIDFSNKTINIGQTNSVVEYSDLFAEIISLYVNTNVGYRQHNGEPHKVYKDDSYGSFVAKFTYPEKLGMNKLTESQISCAIRDMNRDYSNTGLTGSFTYSVMSVCGALHRIWMLEQSGVDVFSIKNKIVLKNTFRIKAKRNEILWMYGNYKRVFNL